MPLSKAKATPRPTSGGAIAAGSPRLNTDALLGQANAQSQSTPPEEGEKDKFRLEAERFLASLPATAKGVLITERGYRAIGGDTTMSDLITLVELMKAELIGNALTNLELIKAVAANIANLQSEPYNLEKDKN